jgi:flagellar M-ring protein FliF
MLAPYLGLDNFEISVAARLNLDKRQVNETTFDPESRAERSLRVVKETGTAQNQNSRSAVGVEQNVPSEQAPAASGDQSKRSNERREELRNYELSSKTTSTVSEGYKIENLAVAVVVNRKRLAETLGANAAPDAIDKQLAEIQRLVESAAGLETKRGDKVTVSAKDFIATGSLDEAAGGPGIVEQLVQQTGALIKALTALGATFLLVWFGLRPTMRLLLSQPSPAPGQPAQEPLAVGGPSPAEHVEAAAARPRIVRDGEPEPNLIADLTSKLGRTPQKRLEQMIDYDEEQAAAILKQWMRGARSA